MPRVAQIHYTTLRSSLVNLPISIYGPLLERSIRPQHLAVVLTSKSTSAPCYVGWTGMASASSLAHFSNRDAKEWETVEIDPQYGLSLGLNQGDLVEIGLLHDLQMATSVATEPFSSDDWEIIETNASLLEQTLLSQVRVATIGQEIDVWVLGRTRVRLRIISLEPSTSSALLLTTNTEVSIAPKLSSDPTSSSTKTDINKSTPPPSQLLRVLPSHLLPSSIQKPRNDETVGLVSPRTYTLLSKTTYPMPKTKEAYKTHLKRLRPPSDPVSPSAASSVPSTKRVLDLSNITHAVDEKEGEKTLPGGLEEVWVTWTDEVPDSHLVLCSGVMGVEEWDLVRVTPTSDRQPASKVLSESETISNSSQAHEPLNSSLAGVDDILKHCTDFCLQSFAVHRGVNAIHGVSALLVTGRSGAGKTSIVQAVANTLQRDPRTYTYTYYVDLSKYSEKPVPTLKSLFRYWFDKALWHKPTILIFDNLDKVVAAEVEHADSFRTRHLTELFLMMYSSSARSAAPNSRGIILLATAPSQAALHSLMSSAHIFTDVVHVKPPNKDARKEILAKIIERRLSMAPDMRHDPNSPLNITALATETEGYSATDLQDLVARAVHHAAIRKAENEKIQMTLKSADFEAAEVDFVPLSLRGINLQKSDVKWSDIGGLHETRKILRETLEWPTKYGPIFAQSPLRLRSGLLLYGFPGCGKTLLASAVAKECGLNFISVKGPELLNKYIGASEKSVRDLFDRASAAKPCVLFFDEFDSIAPKRGHDSTGVTDRVVNQMLTQMDGAEGLDGVYVLAATSRPDLIDPALLRPGRLDKSLFCDMPDVEERKDILEAVSRKVATSPSIDWEDIANHTEGYSGADLQALVYNAHLQVIHASIAAHPTGDKELTRNEEPVEYVQLGVDAERGFASRAEEDALQQRLRQVRYASQSTRSTTTPVRASSTDKVKNEITSDDIRQALPSTRPSVSLEERERLGRIYRAFVDLRSGELPVPPDAGGVGNRSSLM